MGDTETRQATTAVAAVLARAGPDHHVTAGEILTVLRARGWRVPATRPVPPVPLGRPLSAQLVHQHAARAREAIKPREDT